MRLENPTNPSPTPCLSPSPFPSGLSAAWTLKSSSQAEMSTPKCRVLLRKAEIPLLDSLPITHRQLVISTMSSGLFAVWNRNLFLSTTLSPCQRDEMPAGLTLQIQIHFSRWETWQGFRLYSKQMLALKFRHLKEFNLSFLPKHMISQVCGKQESLSWSTKPHTPSP